MSNPVNPVSGETDLTRKSETGLEMIDTNLDLNVRSNISDDGERGVSVVGGGSLFVFVFVFVFDSDDDKSGVRWGIIYQDVIINQGRTVPQLTQSVQH